MNRCQEYAKEEFDLAQSAEEQDKLKFIITSSGTRKVPKSDYNDIPLTIAYALAQHDPAYNLEGIRNENYINAIDSALSSKRDLAMNTVFKQVFKVDLKAVKAAAAVGSSSAADSRYPHSVPAAKQGQNEESKKDNSSNQEQSVSAPTLSTVSAAIVEEMEYGVMHEEVVMEMEKWGVTHEPIVMNAGITDPTAAEPSAGLADSVSLNYDDVDGGNQSDPASDSTDDDVVIIEEVNQSVDDVVIQTSPDVQSSSVTDSLRPMQQEGKTNIAAISREDASPSISLRGVIVPVSPVVELLLPHKDDLSVLLEAGLTQDVLNKIAQQCCQDQVGLLSDLEEEVSTLVINR
ncbi:hypothetical protein EON65_12975 [archaeon]|nr:MAG: hypothetical protein EON65_12975 [archaeon]